MEAPNEFVESQALSLVANGNFNPAIFHPLWLAKNGLITVDEETSATIDITHPELSQFSLPGIKFDVQTERFVLHMSLEPFVRSADLFGRLFAELLPHTPISTCGINFSCHVRLKSWEQRQRFGRILAPVEPWGEFGATFDSDDAEKAGGLTTLSMKGPSPSFGPNCSIGATIQPSATVSDNAGIFVNINHHYKIDDKTTGQEWAPHILEVFDDAILGSRKIIDHLCSTGRES